MGARWNLFAWGIGLAAFGIAMVKEPAAIPLTPPSAWAMTGEPEARVAQSDFPWPGRYVRDSTLTSPGSIVFRTWTPTKGISPLEVTSGPFVPTPYMAVTVTGRTRTPHGGVRLFLACDANAQTLPVLAGSVNTSITEAVIAAPDGWCPGTGRLVLASQERDVNVGAGTVAAISRGSYLKTTALGRLPFLLVSLAVFSALLWAGAALAARLGWYGPPLAHGLAVLGLLSLADFYVVGLVPVGARWVPSVVIVAPLVAAWLVAVWRRQAAWLDLRPYASIWWIAAVAVFFFQGLATSGAGHWEPNYRFWPAVWSSDHELPWLVAQGVRFDLPLRDLFPPWLPTDRPPLMAGANLLLFEPFRLLQWFNDGTYLRGQAFNASAVALGALWVPVGWYLLGLAAADWRVRDRIGVLVTVALLPLSLFNTQYGWPKSLSGAFALLALICAWQTSKDHEQRGQLSLFFILGACAVMAHASAGVLIGPAAVVLLWRHRSRPALVAPGMILAMLVGTTWGVYRGLVLPSRDPLLRFALSGDYGFADPPMSVAAKVRSAYRGVNFSTWAGVKVRMLAQPFVRVTHSMSKVTFSADVGAGLVDGWRRLDVILLAPGNAAIPLFILLGVLATWRHPELQAAEPHMMRAMLIWAAGMWVGLALAFLAPPVMPVWPLGILVGATLSGAVSTARAFPTAYRTIAATSVIYSLMVWGIRPLALALDVDTLAATLLLAFIGALILQRRQLEAALDPREAAEPGTNAVQALPRS